MKKIFLSMVLAFLTLGIFSVSTKATTNLNTTTALIEKKDFPMNLVQNQVLPMYNYEGDDIYDFRKYIKIYEGTNVVLDMAAETPIDKGGYDWNFAGFNIGRLGQSSVLVTYKEASLRLTFTIIEADINAPGLYVYDAGVMKEKSLPAIVTVEAGSNIATPFLQYFVKDNVDETTQLVKRGVDGEFVFKEEYFPNIDVLDDPKINVDYLIEVRIKDKAGNLYSQDIIIRIQDTTAPVIYNIPNIEVKIGNKVNYKENVRVEDTYSETDKITIKYDIVNHDNTLVIGREEDIDALFNTLGEHRIRVMATDESGNSSVRIIRLIVKNSLSVGELILYINLIGIALAGAGIGIYFIVKNKKQPEVTKHD